MTHLSLDNESTDESLALLQEYVDRGLVELSYDTTHDYNTQIRGYNKCVGDHRHLHDWIAVCDVDEYLMPNNVNISLGEALEPFKLEPVVRPQAHVFCSGGHVQRPESIVNGYLYRRKFTHELPKSIVNTAFDCEWKLWRTAHVCRAAKRTRRIGNRAITLNHYATKSFEDYKQKISRGDIRLQDAKFRSMWDITHRDCYLYDDLGVRNLEAKKQRHQQQQQQQSGSHQTVRSIV